MLCCVMVLVCDKILKSATVYEHNAGNEAGIVSTATRDSWTSSTLIKKNSLQALRKYQQRGKWKRSNYLRGLLHDLCVSENLNDQSYEGLQSQRATMSLPLSCYLSRSKEREGTWISRMVLWR